MTLALIFLLSLSTAAAPAKGSSKGKASKVKPKEEPKEDPAANDPAVKAKQIFSRGQQLYAQARYAEAITAFEEAYALKPHPVIFFNIGRCWEQLGETAKALRAYRDYLRMSPDASDRDTVTDAIANLERRLKERGVQQLMVFTDPVDAKIEVDGKPLGSSPASIELTAGNHTLTVKREGYEPVERSFVMSTQRATEMTITLRPAGQKDEPVAADTSGTSSTSGTATAAPAAATDTTPAATATTTAQPRRGRVFTWVAAGLAVVGLGSGISFGLMTSDAARQLGTLDPTRTRADADALVSRASTFALITNISWGVAAAAAIAAVVLFIVEGR